MPKIALYYDDSGYVETINRPTRVRPDMPVGLMGRQVAGKEFLDAYLSYGDWTELVAVVPNPTSAASMRETCRSHASSFDKTRRLDFVETRRFIESFGDEPPARVVHFPCPADSKYAWARQHGGRHSFALCGVTHTLCSATGIESLRNLVTAPFQPYDRLICTSRAVTDMVRSVSDAYAAYLRDLHGGQPKRRLSLETIPLGVNTSKFRPATREERAAERSRLGITDHELAVLFVGRLAHHAKAHPFPLYRAASLAAEATGRRLHLIISGWAASPAILDAFKEGARRFARGVRCTFIDGTAPENRFAVWKAADVFASLSDNIQETFGLVIVEAMASGLPVVATDWNGYRDLVVDGATGFLVPTMLVRHATDDLTVKLIVGELNYDHFLAHASQNVAVDVSATANALARLASDDALRLRLGQAGRERAQTMFDWKHVVAAYEQVWRDQQLERHRVSRLRARKEEMHRSPVYPPLETSFAGYPTSWLDGLQLVIADAGASQRMQEIHSQPLTNHEGDGRCTESTVLAIVLDQLAEPKSIAEIAQTFRAAGSSHVAASATIAWLLKYDLLRTVQRVEAKRGESRPSDAVLTFVVTCMGRLSFLQQTLPHMVAQEGCEVIVVDYSCPESAGDWVEQNYPTVTVLRCPGETTFHRSLAKNAGGFAALTPWICLIDADIVLSPNFAKDLLPRLTPGEFYRANLVGEGTGGTIICLRSDFHAIGGHDPNYFGWGEEDDDLCDALEYMGVRESFFSADRLEHLSHDSDLRMRFHERIDRHHSHLINRMYRKAKWDITRLMDVPLDDGARLAANRELYRQVSAKVNEVQAHNSATEIVIDMGSTNWKLVDARGTANRTLVYRLQVDQGRGVMEDDTGK
ncbi:MAG TPA: glycosyltransferase [Pirellulaceae bacterium]|nr:glycosyltransferase [Pirellulaceae bacterium]